jgi:ammonium transporter, Amt family
LLLPLPSKALRCMSVWAVAFFVFSVSYFSCGDHSNTIPEAAFALFQMMFAVIAPLLVTGAYAERMKFSVSIVFSVLWCA